jgi:hypothetical protein
VLRADIFQADRIPNGFDDLDLLTEAVYQVKMLFGKKNGQGDAGEAAAGTYIENFGARGPGKGRSDGEGMQDMLLIETANVLAGDDIDLFVPFPVNRLERRHLLQLQRGEVGEIA